MNTPLTCRDDGRRDAVRKAGDASANPRLNGIDSVEYDEAGAFRDESSVPVLTVYLLNKAPVHLASANIRIDGGRVAVRVLDFQAIPGDGPDRADAIAVLIDREGDFARHTLALVEDDGHGRPGRAPLAGLDPRFASASFSFKVDCPSDLDCVSADPCPPAAGEEPEIDYLNKDYASFRRLMLDRLALTVPSWKEQSPADLGITLVELLAYVGDHLSYYQDAVATEAYLGTARQRVSVRRHARLVDYSLHEGCNARAWVCLTTEYDLPDKDLGGLQFYAGSLDPRAGEWPVFFEPIGARRVSLHRSHNQIRFYTWGDAECCLARGATSATLWGGPVSAEVSSSSSSPAPYAEEAAEDDEPFPHHSGHPARHRGHHEPYPPPSPSLPGVKNPLHLKVGDVLIFEEVIGPETGDPDDADPARRHAVRLTKVVEGEDPLYQATRFRRPIVEVEWADEDRLPFSFRLSTLVFDPPDGSSNGTRPCRIVGDVSVARGNVLMVDHGATVVEPEASGSASFAVPVSDPTFRCAGPGDPRMVEPTAAVFRPGLKYSGLTHRAEFPPPGQVARGQSRTLARLPGRVREFLPALIARLKATRKPLTDEDREQIETIFGPGVLERYGLQSHDDPAPKAYRWRPRQVRVGGQIRSLQGLLAGQEALLRPKFHRVALLLDDLRAGNLLTAAEAREVGAMFGDAFAPGLDPGDPRWAGPASVAFAQDPRAAVPVISLMQILPDDDGKAPEYCTPPPSWSALAGEQRDLLGGLEDRALTYLPGRPKTPGHDQYPGLIDEIEARQSPLTAGELEQLRILFGDKVLKDFGLPGPGHMRFGHQVRELKRLEAKQEDLLAPKFRKLGAMLDSLARGDVLTEDEVFQVVAMFGPGLTGRLVGPLDREQALWCPKPDLLGSGGDDRDFVVETDDTDRGRIRFGDGSLGKAPAPGDRFRAAYRVGNGVSGNVGAETIRGIATNSNRPPAPPGGLAARNPLPASGGIAPEPTAEAKLFAPGAFRVDQPRAVTTADFARLAALHPGVRLAAALRRWTGSWVEFTVAIAPHGTDDVPAELIEETEADLVAYRRIGYDVRVVPATFIGVVIGLTVEVLPHFLRGHVEAALLEVFSDGINADGRPGLFDPDLWSFGQPVEFSRVVAAAQGVAGVRNVSVARFHRFGEPGHGDPAAGPGVLAFGPLEIPRLDNDPDFPERGSLSLDMRGGR